LLSSNLLIELSPYNKLLKNSINLKELSIDTKKLLLNIDINDLFTDLLENLLTTKSTKPINLKSLLSKRNILDFDLLFLLNNSKKSLVGEKLILNLSD